MSVTIVMVQERYGEQIRLELKFLYNSYKSVLIHIIVDVWMKNDMGEMDEFRIKNALCSYDL